MGADDRERKRGDEASLLTLYAAVPSAEELDLAEEPEASRPAPVPVDETADPDEPDALEPAERHDDEDVTPLTDRQARGVLEHLLGAEPVEDEPDENG